MSRKRSYSMRSRGGQLFGTVSACIAISLFATSGTSQATTETTQIPYESKGRSSSGSIVGFQNIKRKMLPLKPTSKTGSENSETMLQQDKRRAAANELVKSGVVVKVEGQKVFINPIPWKSISREAKQWAIINLSFYVSPYNTSTSVDLVNNVTGDWLGGYSRWGMSLAEDAVTTK